MKRIGILALQGAFLEHAEMIRGLGAEAFLVRSLADTAAGMDGLILPGGESTAMRPLLDRTGLTDWLLKQARAGLPIFGTCAGMILLSTHHLNLLDVDTDRNAYGPQLYSFEAELSLDAEVAGGGPSFFPGIFIRAPKITRLGAAVHALARHGETPVLVRQNNLMAASFHPELSGDPRIHAYFLRLC